MPAGPRILAIAPSWLGDAVLVLPALELLADAGAELEILVRLGTSRVFEERVPSGSLHVTSPTSRLRRLLDAARTRARRPDAALVFAPSFTAALAALASGAATRIGETTGARRGFLTHAVRPAGRGVHLSLAYQRLAECALACLALPPPVRRRALPEGAPRGLYALPRLAPRDEELRAATALLGESGVAPGEQPLVVAPGARYGPAKRYPAERFACVAGAIASRLRRPVVLVGGAADRPETTAVRARLPGSVDLAGQTTLGALLGVLARACGVLANDSGVMHLASALGTPVVGVFGSTNPHWTRPLGPRSRVASHPVPCSPCYARKCPLDFECMLGLEPEVLVTAFLGLSNPEEAPLPRSLRL
jgi:heptosyltransferase-2